MLVTVGRGAEEAGAAPYDLLLSVPKAHGLFPQQSFLQAYSHKSYKYLVHSVQEWLDLDGCFDHHIT